MKQHIFGFAIFSFIVISAVFLKFYFYVPESFDVPAPEVNSSSWKMKREFRVNISQQKIKKEIPISYKIQDLTFDADENVLTSKVEISWNGVGRKPDTVTVLFNFFTLENPAREIPVASELILSPFAESNTITKTFKTFVKANQLLNTNENYYSSIEFGVIQKNSGSNLPGVMTRTFLSEDEKLAQAFPVLMIHEK